MSATLVLNNENFSMNRKKFSVVHFKSDDKVEAVPSSWINEDNQCYWPKTSLPNLKKVLQDSAFKPGVDWVKYDVEVIKSYDNYNKASKKATEYTIHSDLDTSEVEPSRKRKRKSTANPTDLPAPPVTRFMQNPSVEQPTIASADPITLESIYVINQGLNIQEPGTHERVLPEVVPTTSSVYSAYPDTHQTFQNPNGHQVFQLQPSIGQSGLSNDLLLAEFRRFQEVMLQRHEELKAEIKTLRTAVLTTQPFLAPSTATTSFVTSQLPISSIEQLKKIEDDLKGSSEYNELVSLMSRIGGETAAKNVYNIMRVVISHELSLKLRFTDQSGKEPFGKTLIAQAIRESIHKSPRKHVTTDIDIDRCIARWLRNAKEQSKVEHQHGGKKHEKAKNQESCSRISQPNSVDGDSTNDD